MSLYIAFRIAQCHSESGRDEMTMKSVSNGTLTMTRLILPIYRYCQRILRPYASEGWGSVVWAIRALWYQAAQRTASVETAVKLLLEMMAPGKNCLRNLTCYCQAETAFRAGGAPVPQDATQYQDDLQALLTVSCWYNSLRPNTLSHLPVLTQTTAPENDNVDIHLPSQAHSICM
jgi:hypothetical protein